MPSFFDKQLDKRPFVVIALVAAATVIIAGGTGLLGKPTQLIGRAWGGLMFKVKSLFGGGERRA